MNERIKSSLLVYPRTAVGAPEIAAATATAVITLQALLVLLNAAPMATWFYWIFALAGPVSLMGSVALVVWRRSIGWSLVLALSLFDWWFALTVLSGLGIARMH